MANGLKQEIIDILEYLYEDTECRFDHHGYCQEHYGGFSDKGCTNPRMKKVLEELKMEDENLIESYAVSYEVVTENDFLDFIADNNPVLHLIEIDTGNTYTAHDLMELQIEFKPVKFLRRVRI